MPFPLAHPAAVLPLRRYCPRRLNFPALVIGSLSPDVAYAFGRLHLDRFSHRFIGSLGFCLPVGLLLLLLFYLGRGFVVQYLPARHRRIFEPLCRGPAGSPFLIAISVLIGAWTHVFLDALTHGNGWFVEHLSFLQAQVTVGNHQARVCDLLYAACTFLGAAWVASAYLNWLERAAGNSGWVFPGFKWISTLVVATVTLLLSFGSRGAFPSLGLFALGILTVILVILFLAVTGWGLRNARRPQPGGSRLPSG